MAIRDILRMPDDGSGGSAGGSGANWASYANTAQNVAGILGGIFGGISQGRLNDWLKGAAIMAHQQAIAGNASAIDAYYKIQSLIQNPSSEITQSMLRQIVDQAPFLQQSFEQNFGDVKNLFNNAGDRFATPDQDQIQQALRLLAGQTGATADTASQVFQGGGWTPQYQDLLDRLAPFASGQASNAQLALGDVGPNLIGQRGQTALTQSLTDAAMRSSDSGGMSPELKFALGKALETLQAQGKTPSLENLSSQALRLLSSGGANKYTDTGSDASLDALVKGGENAYTQFAQNRGADLAGREALLPMDRAVQMATEDAQGRAVKQAQKLREQARLRGGEFTRSGAANEGLWDVSSDVMEKVAQARRAAMLQQQQLQQQENQIGAGLLASGGGLANSRFGTAGSTLGNLQGVAAQRLGIGANLAPAGEQIAAGREATALQSVPGVQNSATGSLEAALRAGLGAGDLETARMNLGMNMSNSLTQQQQQALQQLLAVSGQQNQYALGAGQLANSGNQTIAGILNSVFNNRQGQQQLGVTAAGAQAGAGTQALSLQNDLQRTFGSNFATAGGFLNNSAGNMLNYAGSWIPGMNPFGQLGGLSNPWASLASQKGS